MSNTALQRVYQQFEEQEKHAARAYALIQQDAERYHSQMQQLSDYRKQYLQQFTERGEEGISGSSYAHYHNFMKKLELAEFEQKQALDNIKQTVNNKHADWMEIRKKRDALGLLLDKRKVAAQLVEQRREQKDLDEFSNFQYFKRKNNR
ncbi:Flagellar protein FliJ [Moritella sp. JT01]|uniref:flagellar export protein FliJ n=1 Tax=Moritella sp. JT01 TaxID=756698 RepID=UPI000795C65E|nr:flagellar export protein FliJ [Moritella sp. JT01]KXO14211.1 Flagellar protein FliJ [Moritella sp. JT01]